jgi:hypothetical protein
VSQPLPAGMVASGWLQRFAPNGQCRRCGKELPPGRRFTHEECDAIILAERQQLEAASRPTVVQPWDLLLSSIPPASLLKGRVPVDEPDFPVEDCWSQAWQNLARTWTPGQGSIWVAGTIGSGKSTIFAGLVLRLRRAGVPVCVTSWESLLGWLRVEMLADAGRYQQLLEGLQSVPVLAIDDLLIRPRLTEWQQEVLYQVAEERLNRNLPLVATCNLRLSKLAKAMGGEEMAGRISSRLQMLTRLQVRCIYPGDRRTGEHDRALEEKYRAILQLDGGAR